MNNIIQSLEGGKEAKILKEQKEQAVVPVGKRMLIRIESWDSDSTGPCRPGDAV